VLESEHPRDLRITAEAPVERLLVVAAYEHAGRRVTADVHQERPIRVHR
jgi:hypothetical protein